MWLIWLVVGRVSDSVVGLVGRRGEVLVMCDDLGEVVSVGRRSGGCWGCMILWIRHCRSGMLCVVQGVKLR